MGLKLSKWALQDFVACPRRFKAIHIDKVACEQSPEAKLGEDFHEFARSFFARVPYRQARKLHRLHDIEELFCELVDADGELGLMETNFCKFEAAHFWKLKQLVPQKLKRFFYPLDLELTVETDYMFFRVDRIDLLLNRKACVVEYKTSTHWNLSSLRRELAFYCVGLKRLMRYKRFYRPEYIACYNPRLDRFFFEKLSKNTVRSMYSWLKKMEEAFKTGVFPRRISGLCRYCPIAKECLEEVPKW